VPATDDAPPDLVLLPALPAVAALPPTLLLVLLLSSSLLQAPNMPPAMNTKAIPKDSFLFPIVISLAKPRSAE
jgi:hypothetical protein